MVTGVFELAYIFLATFIVSLISFVGVASLALNEKVLNKILLVLIGLSAGALMGGALLHLLPEAVEKNSDLSVYMLVLVGFILFFLIEKVLHWRHCHKGKCDVHTFHYMNLVGDSIHNFIDGLIMAASYVVSLPLGITTTIAIATHEIPQEIGDFAVLLYGGFSKKKAILLNFVVALTAVIGGIVGFFVSSLVENIVIYILPFAAGGFIYIAATDLVPEIRKELDMKKYMATLLVFICGILIMWVTKVIFEA
ncbi:MAG: ZIP family metal transporter [Candidatus Thermoplasmatota archaeon]|nr:ZIP family metal transporter [Candidatus Thermoplasmatota archaeon]